MPRLQVDAGQTYTYNGTMTVAAGGTVTKTGPGSLLMGSSLPAAPLVVNGGVLDLGGLQTHTPTAVTFASGTVQNGALLGSSYTFNGPATVSASLQDGPSGPSSLLVNNSAGGTSTLSGSNTYSGGTTISAGTLASLSQSSLGTGPITLSGGALRVAGGLPGLQEGWLNGAFDTTDPFSSSILQSVQLSPRAANWAYGNGAVIAPPIVLATSTGNYTTASNGTLPPGTVPNFPNNTTAIYSGYMYLPANQVLFYKNFDDSMLLTIAGSQVINNGAWNQFVTANYTAPNGAGWYSFELRLGQGGGGVGPNLAGYPTGFGYDMNGSGGTVASNYVFPVDPGNATLFTYSEPGTANYSNPLNVTSPSTLNITGLVDFASLSLSSTLHVSSGGPAPLLTITGATSIAGSATLNVDSGVNVILPSLTNGGGATLIAAGSGSVILTGMNMNSFTGGRFQANGSTLVAVGQSYPNGANEALGSAPITLNNGTLVLSLAATTASVPVFDMVAGNAVTLAGSGGSIIAAADPTGTVSVSGGTIDLAASGVFSVAAGQKLNLGTSNGYTLLIDPALKFSNSGTISGGPGSVALMPVNLTASAGTLSAASGGTLTMGGLVTSGTYSPAATGTVVLSGTYSGVLANLKPLAGGFLVINDNTTSGTLTVANGAYVASGASSFGPATLSLDGGTLAATAALTGSNAVGNLLVSTTSGVGNRTLNFGGSSPLQLTSGLGLNGGTTTINDPNGVGTLSGVLSGSGALSLSGSPTLSNVNTYTGATKFNSGEAKIGSGLSLGSGTLIFAGGGFQSTTPLTAITNPWQISKGSAAYFGASGGPSAIQLSASTSLPSAGTELIHITNPNLTVTLSGLIAGNSNLVRASDAAGQVNGTLVLSNSGNSFQYFTLQSLGGNVDVMGASTQPAGATSNASGTTITSGPLGIQTVTLGSANSGSIALENSAPTPVTLGNALSIIDDCGFVSAAGMTFSGPVVLSQNSNGFTNFSLGAGSIIAFSGQISGPDGINLRSGSGAGGLTLSGVNNYTGPTSITMGTLIAGGNAPYNSGGVFGSSSSAITIGDANSAGNPAALVTNGPYTIARPITVNATAGPTTLGTVAAGTSTFSGAITLDNSGSVTLSAAAGGSAVFTGPISGTGGITAASPGNGNVSLASTAANADTYSGATTVSSGRLTLDYSLMTPTGGTVGGMLPDSPVTLGGGTLAFNGNASAAVNEALLSTTVANFGAALVATPSNGHAVQVALGPISRSGGVLDVPANAAFTTTSSNTNGILGGYLSFNGYQGWAAVNGSGQIGALATYSNVYAAGNNVDVTSLALTPSGAVNSLRFNTTPAGTLQLGGGLTLASGGILVTPTVGANNVVISGGALTSSSGTTASNSLADVVVLQGDSSAPLTINSPITDNGGASVGLTKGGPGTLILGGSNTFSGPTTVSAGLLEGSIGAGNFPTNIAVNAGAALTFVENGALAASSSISISGSGR